MQTVARILLTLTALGYGLGTIKADFNQTHATNPAWTPHARFHVVWQILSYSGIGLIALYLIWAGGPMPVQRLYFAAALGVAIYGAFFTTVFARPLYKGTLRSERLPAVQASHRTGSLALGCQRHGIHLSLGNITGSNPRIAGELKSVSE
jgi:hypothetical protein